MKTSNVCHINGKEKDFETGYHCYGARYCDSEKINRLSVDGFADKYPSMSPYAYCAILVDPDGRDWYEHKNKDGSKAVVGKQLHYKWVENIVMPQFEMGILGLPSTMPFK
ncbi:MAG TPA: hypothetical protein IAC47_02275 [Candidatus Onthomorpha intestinigallinarum]|uniref:Uncharacterized protein n=1 Tax=Candidatus Onthomorpha intestinigallinarum TaxID=2840880 RepID=A0A9D1RH93_9BACT|nr:hypothetical protein [Candidatus Onthomorpha intestinigallinarum]